MLPPVSAFQDYVLRCHHATARSVRVCARAAAHPQNPVTTAPARRMKCQGDSDDEEEEVEDMNANADGGIHVQTARALARTHFMMDLGGDDEPVKVRTLADIMRGIHTYLRKGRDIGVGRTAGFIQNTVDAAGREQEDAAQHASVFWGHSLRHEWVTACVKLGTKHGVQL